MDEGTIKAIPLRRSRGGVRVLTARSLRLTERLTAGVRRVLSPPRQIWLASLGGAVLAVRGARAAWSQLVTEGAAVEGWLRHTLAGAADREARG